KLGKIDDLMIEKATGRTTYALMSFRRFPGCGNALLSDPLADARLRSRQARLQDLALAREQIEKGRHVPDKEIKDEVEWREAVHAYYGSPGYWVGPIGL
ncbi:hypothetical protein CSW58_11130, partial [Caulobacter sp. B11]|uniref:PRC-barrel domain-containing protein n=1 Tax=Caulobacter sp. B11 TaxID=2048899 RepID=UPI000C12A3F7